MNVQTKNLGEEKQEKTFFNFEHVKHKYLGKIGGM